MARKTWARYAGRALVWLVLLGLTLLVVTRFAGLDRLGAAFSRADGRWLAAALGVHLVFFALYGLLYRESFAIVGVRSRVRELLPVYFAAALANAVAPAGGATGAALFVADAQRRGQPGARAAVGVLVVLVVDLVTLVPFLLYGLDVLRTRGEIAGWVIAGSAVYLATLLLLGAGLVLADRSGAREERLLRWGARQVNRVWRRLRHRELLGEGWAEHTRRQLADAATAVVRARRAVLAALALGVLLHAVNMIDLWAVFRAFDQPVGVGPLSAGFSLGIVFFVVGIVPQGLAVVEGVMAFVFTLLGFPRGPVAAAVLSFRAVNFLLPILVGAVFARRVMAARAAPSAPAAPDAQPREP